MKMEERMEYIVKWAANNNFKKGELYDSSIYYKTINNWILEISMAIDTNDRPLVVRFDIRVVPFVLGSFTSQDLIDRADEIHTGILDNSSFFTDDKTSEAALEVALNDAHTLLWDYVYPQKKRANTKNIYKKLTPVTIRMKPCEELWLNQLLLLEEWNIGREPGTHVCGSKWEASDESDVCFCVIKDKLHETLKDICSLMLDRTDFTLYQFLKEEGSVHERIDKLMKGWCLSHGWTPEDYK